MAKKRRSQSRFGEMESLFGDIESRFGEENGEVNRALAKNWRRHGEENGEEIANSIALYWGFKGDTPYDIVGSSLRFFYSYLHKI